MTTAINSNVYGSATTSLGGQLEHEHIVPTLAAVAFACMLHAIRGHHLDGVLASTEHSSNRRGRAAALRAGNIPGVCELYFFYFLYLLNRLPSPPDAHPHEKNNRTNRQR
jgi:hypothetical protein